MGSWWAWLLLVTGGHWPGNVPTTWYNEESGFLSIILPVFLQLLGITLLFWWHHQCGVSGCFWYARRTTAAGERACWKHHPHTKRTAGDVHEAHHRAVAAQLDRAREDQP